MTFWEFFYLLEAPRTSIAPDEIEIVKYTDKRTDTNVHSQTNADRPIGNPTHKHV